MRVRRPSPIAKTLDLRRLTQEEKELVNTRFWRMVHRNRLDGCWRFGSGSPMLPHQAGAVNWQKKMWPASYFSYALHHGRIETGMYLWRACGIANCVNPTHLVYADYTTMQQWFANRPELSPPQVAELRRLFFTEGEPIHRLMTRYDLMDREVRKLLFK